ncbi:MAG TPA: thiosulfate oxidation carrier protein SoxY [Hyphomicrobiaceae bacterium]|nr:thiosulfate oxidation carrier protein SoxY [Hyphomicrobiaceae bacterium]
MTQRLKLEVVDRRDFVVGAATAAALTALFGRIGNASAEDKPPTFDEVYKKILGDKKPEEGKVNIELPEIAENGNTVPYSVMVESPMTDADFVKAIHVLAPGNPGPTIATFHFTPLSGTAKVSSRMRLAKTQDIVAVAELSNGSMLVGKRTVKVTIGGCGG